MTGFSGTTVIANTLKRLQYDLENQKVQADNLARAAIPGEQEKELKPFTLEPHKGGHGRLKKTNPHHISPKVQTSTKKPLTATLTGNTIDTDRALQEMNESTIKSAGNLQALKMLYAREKLFSGGR